MEASHFIEQKPQRFKIEVSHMIVGFLHGYPRPNALQKNMPVGSFYDALLGIHSRKEVSVYQTRIQLCP